MTTQKRTIRGEKHDIAALVDGAMATAGAGNLADAEAYLRRCGHTNPDAALIARVARERAILIILERQTGATFTGQIGKISFDDRDQAIRQANAYLDRRNQGHRSRWGK